MVVRKIGIWHRVDNIIPRVTGRTHQVMRSSVWLMSHLQRAHQRDGGWRCIDVLRTKWLQAGRYRLEILTLLASAFDAVVTP